MADVVAARREARRRRILENSQNRLQRISGKCDDYPRESPIRTVIPEPIHEISVTPASVCLNDFSLSNGAGAILSETDSFDLLTFNHDNANHEIAAGDQEVPGDLAQFTSPLLPQEPAQTSHPWEKLTNHRYDIVLLSILMQLLYSLSLITFDDTYFFLPILVYTITKLIWFPSQSNSKISNALMLLQGISSYKVQRIIDIMQYVGVISCDICIFLFTTICIQSFYITLKSSLIT